MERDLVATCARALLDGAVRDVVGAQDAVTLDERFWSYITVIGDAIMLLAPDGGIWPPPADPQTAALVASLHSARHELAHARFARLCELP